MNFTSIMNSPYLIFMAISALCAAFELILIIKEKSNNEFLIIGNVTAWIGLLFVFLDYLFGKYNSLAQAMKALSDHLLLFGQINIVLLIVSALALLYVKLSKKGRATDNIKAIFIRSTVFVAISIILRWLLTSA